VGYNIKLTVVGKTRKLLNIGGPVIDPSRGDNPFYRIIDSEGESYLYIPGSTLKGVLRKSALKVAGLLGYKVGFSVHPDIMDHEDIVSKVFGAPGLKSKIIVSGALLSEMSIVPEIYTHIRVDEKTGIVDEGALFEREYLPIGTSFEFEINGYDMDIEEARLLLAALYEMRYEKLGRGGLIEVSLRKTGCHIPNELLGDDVVRMIYDELAKE